MYDRGVALNLRPSFGAARIPLTHPRRDDAMETLSEHLREYLRQMDDDLLKGTEPEEVESTRDWIAGREIRALWKSLASFVAIDESVFNKLYNLVQRDLPAPEKKFLSGFITDRFDDYYTRSFLEDVPKMVERTLKLSQLHPGEMPTGATNTYLLEATRCYIFGLWQATIALSRAALEEGLRERVEAVTGKSPTKLSDILKVATDWGLLRGEASKLASNVKLAGDRVLHGRPSNDKESWQTLSASRKVLLSLFCSARAS